MQDASVNINTEDIEDITILKKGFDVVSISIDKRDADWRKAVNAEELTWTNLRDTDETISRDYEVKAVITMFLVDSNGTIVMTDARGEALANKLAELLK